MKRSGDREPFDREKVATGIRLAAKGRPIEADGGEALDELINAVEDAIRLEGGEVTSEAVGRSVLERLREADPVAAVRFASVYLGFDDLSDFEREIRPCSPSAPSPSATERRAGSAQRAGDVDDEVGLGAGVDADLAGVGAAVAELGEDGVGEGDALGEVHARWSTAWVGRRARW